MERRRFKQLAPSISASRIWLSVSGKKPAARHPGVERNRLIRRARQIETASHINERLSSPGLRAPA
jgi:hypothetical protein